MDSSVIKLAALSRPFRLGMLYDCRTDQLIPGITLWDNEFLQQGTVTQRQESANFVVFADETISDKANKMDIDASLKLSFLGGLVDVSGSAKYLDDRKSSNYKARVTLQYKTTTIFRQLTMSNIQIRHAFDEGIATHVVTGIQYGGQTFMVFEKTLSENDNKNEVQRLLHLSIKKIPCIQNEGDALISLDENEKITQEELECKFFGDFIPDTNPTTYTDAVNLFSKLPELMGTKSDTSVPVTVWLYPLEKLDSKAAKLVRQISSSLVLRSEKVIENLHQAILRSNDLATSDTCQKFPSIKQSALNFKGMIEEHKLNFQKQILAVVPQIREGVAEETMLVDILEKREASAFGQLNVEQWLNDEESLIGVLNIYIKSMVDIDFAVNPGDLDAKILDPSNRYVVCFKIRLSRNDAVLTAMQSYLDNNSQSFITTDSQLGEMYGVLADTLPRNARSFQDCAKANATTEGVAFVIQEDCNDSEPPSGFMCLYMDGKLKDGNYEPPSRPGTPRLKATAHHSIYLEWDEPEHGNNLVQQYVISYRKISEGSTKWYEKVTDDNSPSFTLDSLSIDSVYHFTVKAKYDVGVSQTSDLSDPIQTRPTSPPGKPKVWRGKDLDARIEWSHPEVTANGVNIIKYILQSSYSSTSPSDNSSESDNWCDLASTSNIDPNHIFHVNNCRHIYYFRVQAECGPHGKSEYSEASEAFTINASVKDTNKEKIRQSSTLVKKGSPSVYALKLNHVLTNKVENIYKHEFGSRHKKATVIPEKVIMVIGATGAGKTTLINGLINYILGVKWTDPFRFKLVIEQFQKSQARSQTTAITSYTIHHQNGFEMPFTLTIIDTPGFGDTSGISRDKEITKQIHSFFTTKGAGGIDHIDAICFVAQASLARLTPTQKYVFYSILSLFGKDVADIIFIMATFADGQKPPLLAGIKESQFPYNTYFKFNNSALFAQNTDDKNDDRYDDDEDDHGDNDDGDNNNFNAILWEMGMKSFKNFLAKLKATTGRSLTLTQGVLDERSKLEVYIEGIQQGIRTGLNKLEQLKIEEEVLRTHQAAIDANKDFTYTVQEETATKVDIPPGTYITNCLTCNRTCHYPCRIPDDNRKRGCAAMQNGNYCVVCPKGCHWTMHKNMQYKFEFEIRKVEKTAEDLRRRYQDAQGKRLSAEQITENICIEFEDVQLEVLMLADEVKKSLNRLQEIALLPNALSSVEYIDILIQSVQDEAKPGWQKNVYHLAELRKQNEDIIKISKDGYDPFQSYRTAKLKLPHKKEGGMTQFRNFMTRNFMTSKAKSLFG